MINNYTSNMTRILNEHRVKEAIKSWASTKGWDQNWRISFLHC